MLAVVIVRFGVVVIISPIFGIPGVALCIVGTWLGHLFMKAQLAVKRERSNARAPVLGHVSDTLGGLGTFNFIQMCCICSTAHVVSIRAYGVQNSFRNESFKRIDSYTRATITFNNLTRCA